MASSNIKGPFFLLPILLLLLSTHTLTSTAKKVILFSIPHAANVRTHGNLARALTSRGHEAYVCVPQFMIREKKMNLEGFKVIQYGDQLGNFAERLAGHMIDQFWKRDMNMFTFMRMIFNETGTLARSIVSDRKFLQDLKNVDADLFVMTHLPPTAGLSILPYILEKPFALFGPLYDPHLFRIPHSAAGLSCPINENYQHRDMTFSQRLKNTLIQAAFFLMSYTSSLDAYIELAKDTGVPRKNLPSISYPDLILKSEINVVETDHILDYPKPTLPNTVLVGGTAATKSKPLKEPFKSFMDGSKDGLVLVTFGSVIIDIPDKEVLSNMLSAFSKFKQRVVWRGNVQSPDPDKILVSKWVPQNDILAHKNLQLFVSHCGANGNYEALFHGVPLLCLPFDGDQFYNSQRTVDRGFGLKADIRDLREQDWIHLVSELTQNSSYRDNIQRASKLYHELYKDPVETAAYWIDHVMKYGGRYMRSAGHEMELYQYLMLDVWAFVGVVVVVFVWVVVKLCGCLCRLCCGRGGGSGKKKTD